MTSLTIEEWHGADSIKCAEALHALPYAIFLDSNRLTHPLSRYSFIGWNPVETIEVNNNQKNIFDLIKENLDRYQFTSTNFPFPFHGGLMGYIAYDMSAQFGVYTSFLAFDHAQNKAWIVYEDKKQKEFLEKYLNKNTILEYKSFTPEWKTDKSDDEYCKDVETLIEKIYDGDVYQINLTRKFETDRPRNFSSFAHYKKLRTINSAPFSAYMNFGDFQISSCSPERFIKITGQSIETRPIKGTLSSNHSSDLLSKDPKERAENTMIVDLLRNDISKVCQPHSVKVPTLCGIETFEGLHHMVSTVTGNLKNNMTASDVLRECLPGGSITGAPKISAMNIINDIEPVPRGIYCGSIGYIGFNGDMDMNIAIRTLVHTKDKIHFHVGGGIVSDSNPKKELQETYDKAQKIFESFES